MLLELLRRLLVALRHRVSLAASLAADEGHASRTELPGRIQRLLRLQGKYLSDPRHVAV